MSRRRRDALRAADQTTLAFRRTALQIGLIGLATVRVMSERFGLWTLLAAVGAGLLILAVHRAAATFADTVDAEGDVDWAPHGVGHATARHVLVASASAAVAVLALAWMVTVRPW